MKLGLGTFSFHLSQTWQTPKKIKEKKEEGPAHTHLSDILGIHEEEVKAYAYTRLDNLRSAQLLFRYP